MSKIEMLKQLERSTPHSPQLRVINELSQLRQIIETLPDLPEAISQELVDRLRPLEEMQQRLDELAAAQRAAINELTQEIAVSATEHMEQITDQLQSRVQDLDPAMNRIQKLSTNMVKVHNAMGHKLIPKIDQMIEDLEDSTADLDRAIRRRGRSHLVTALVTGLIFSLITISAMIAMPRIWGWLQL